jgi:nitrate reductase NapE component
MRSAMISLDRMVGWFPHTSREWIEFIIVALLLWLLMVVAISELEVIPI